MTSSKFLFLFTALFVFGCSGESEGERDVQKSAAEAIVDDAIAFHGGPLYDEADISFMLRNRAYTISRNGGKYVYTSSHDDSLGVYRRELSNAGFTETLNGSPLALTAKDSLLHAESVNSVVYFTLLPAFLNDPAVYKTLDGTDTLGGKAYHRIKVTFDEQGGGVDHDDVYLYWFDKETSRMDYLAYSFTVNDGGSRFRKAVNSRRINGIIFQDYENYKGPAPDSLAHIADMFRAGRLQLLSMVELNSISVVTE